MLFGESRSNLPITLIKIRFYPILWSTSMIEIHFTWYVKNVKSFLSQKSLTDLVEKIKNKNKKRTCASLFQYSEDGKQEKKFMRSYLLFYHFKFYKIQVADIVILYLLPSKTKFLLCKRLSSTKSLLLPIKLKLLENQIQFNVSYISQLSFLVK